MKDAFLILFTNLFSIICAILGAYMAVNHITGWGWFLLAGILSHCTPQFKDKTEKKDE
jgi:hypothetical protein